MTISSNERPVILAYMDEIQVHMEARAEELDQIKDILNILETSHGLDKKIVRRAARIRFNNSLKDEKAAFQAVEDFLDALENTSRKSFRPTEDKQADQNYIVVE